MTRHVVIGTAGHVDHGKTALVKALTGVDTDRFPEEQKRGITIDIGFAPLDLGGEVRASVVDVPGHEDFIRNMVAGATGIDLALLVVAADEGVMPQTVEHLAILELLGVQVGAVAITKADLAEPDWLDLVRSDVEERLRRTSIAWEAPVPVSVINGRGIEQLRGTLAEGAARTANRARDDLFRMPVDRVFSLAGAGTVITGTTWSGSVKVGQQVSILPQGVSGRVRSVEVHGMRRDEAEPGRRTALALAGVERAEAGRGSVAVTDPAWRSTSTIDVRLSLLPDAPRSITQRTRLRLHLGTAEVLARVTPAAGDIAPGESGIVRLRLEEPLVARWGDRGVIRAYSPVATIGGCVVVDPWPVQRPHRPIEDSARESADPPERIRSFAVNSGAEGIPVGDLPVRAGIHAGQVAEMVSRALETPDLRRVSDRIVPAAVLEAVREEALRSLSRYHAAHPLAPGMPLELLRQAIRSVTLGEYVLAELEQAGKIISGFGVARLADHAPVLDAKQEHRGAELLGSLTSAGTEGRTLQELDEVVRDGSAREIIEYYVRQGTAVRVGEDRYYERNVLDGLARRALVEIQRVEGATPAQLRDHLQLSRKYLIPLLEWLDLKGFTLRAGDARRVTPGGMKFLQGS
jgi:selenocysteine-specific elongation factor